MPIKRLQAKTETGWEYVFCHNERHGLILTETKAKAVKGSGSLEYFKRKYSETEFRLVR